MAGTIIITGANGSLALGVVEQLLSKYPEYTTVLTVRNTSTADANTERLRAVIARHPGAKTSIRQLDLTSLAAVDKFASTIAAEIADNQLPRITSLICNAYFWNMIGPAEMTGDGVEKTLQVNYVANVTLVLYLLGSFAPGGRIVFFSTYLLGDSKAATAKYPVTLPDDMDKLNDATPYDDVNGRGWHRYAMSKLACVTFVNALNARLEEDPELKSITAVAMDPGNLVDSRALRTNMPRAVAHIQRFVLKPCLPVLKLLDPAMKTAAAAAVDVTDLAIGKAFPGERGHFTTLKKDKGPKDSLDKGKQDILWDKSLQWAGVDLARVPLRITSDP